MAMVTITATGHIVGEKNVVEVTRTDHGFLCLFNGEEDKVYEKWLMAKIARPPPMGGTYFPEPYSAMAAYSSLIMGFFDERESALVIKVDGDIGTVPQPDGPSAIY